MHGAVDEAVWERWLEDDERRMARLELDAELRRAWLRRLEREWRALNWQHRLGLQPPEIVLLGSSRRWGSWDRARRRIGISERQVACYTWDSVADTLRHEMAHQYVDEVLGGDRRPHGALFAGACHRLGISPSATGDGGVPIERPAPDRTADDGRLRRIRKLLALAGDRCNEHEARTALATARRLLLEYNVDVAEAEGLTDYAHRVLGPPSRRTPAYRNRLALLLREHFFVRVLWLPVYDAEADREGKGLEVMGTTFNVDMAAYVWDFLHSQGELLWQQFRRGAGPQRPYARHQFLDGLMAGFQQHVADERARPQEGRALVWKGDAALESWSGRRHPRVRSSKWYGARPTAARAAGVEEGRRLRLRRPIENAPAARGRELPAGPAGRPRGR